VSALTPLREFMTGALWGIFKGKREMELCWDLSSGALILSSEPNRVCPGLMLFGFDS
jgi:hypothetical protein